MTEQNKAMLKDLIGKLKAAGEDKAEMDFWLETFDSLSAEKQKELFDILKKELSQLSSAK